MFDIDSVFTSDCVDNVVINMEGPKNNIVIIFVIVVITYTC